MIFILDINKSFKNLFILSLLVYYFLVYLFAFNYLYFCIFFQIFKRLNIKRIVKMF